MGSPVNDLMAWSGRLLDRLALNAHPDLADSLTETALETVLPLLAFHWLGATNDNDAGPVSGDQG